MAAHLFLLYKGEFKKVICKYKTPHLNRRLDILKKRLNMSQKNIIYVYFVYKFDKSVVWDLMHKTVYKLI